MYPQKRVLYVSARTFQVQFVNAQLKGKINDFIAFYQTVDMLIVDDVQEWTSSPKTQETFFHIFNHLFRNSKRIILDSKPKNEVGDCWKVFSLITDMYESNLKRLRDWVTLETKGWYVSALNTL